jgi:hypothetical protein
MVRPVYRNLSALDYKGHFESLRSVHFESLSCALREPQCTSRASVHFESLSALRCSKCHPWVCRMRGVQSSTVSVNRLCSTECLISDEGTQDQMKKTAYSLAASMSRCIRIRVGMPCKSAVITILFAVKESTW